MKNIFKAPLLFTILAVSISSCGGGGGSDKPSATFHPAQSNSPYKDVLVGCINPSQSTDLCKLSRLPFIGQATNSPTKEDILAHTITSHPWMATRFSELLDKMPNDILLLFRGVTGVSIGADIRPSYYDPSTGAIYLDPADLWLTKDERSTISRAPDYRQDFGNELKFSWLWRYVKYNDYAWDDYPLDGVITNRSIDTIVQPMAALLFHELAHANDFMPPALLSQVNPQNTVEAQAAVFSPQYISTDLTSRLPLTSTMLFGVGDVLFHGTKVSSEQKQFTAEQVGLAFAVDGASDAYAYSSQYEDTAMLFEETMMKYHFNIDREMAFTDAPTTAKAYCNEYVVRWGVHNRIGNETVKARAQVVVQQLLGSSDATKYFIHLPTSRSMNNGWDWCANLSGVGINDTGKLQKMSYQSIRESDLRPLH